jgi:hypothetical protein
MTRLRVFAAAMVLLVSATLCAFAGDSDFDVLVREVVHRYGAHATRIPMMSMVSLCARFATHGGVKGLRVAEFDDFKPAVDASEVTSLVGGILGPEWRPFIDERAKRGERQSVIFVRQKGDTMRMMIADYDHGELDVVRVELSGDALAKWMKDPHGEAHCRNGKAQTE